MIHPDGQKKLSRWNSSAMLSRFTVKPGGATFTAIADLGITEATLSSWCKAAGVPARHRRLCLTPAAPAAPAGVEAGQWARTGPATVEVANLRAAQTKLGPERDVLRGGQVVRRGLKG